MNNKRTSTKKNLIINKESNTNTNVAQAKWTLEKIASGVQFFYNEYGRYPTAIDFDRYPKLPSARHVQRKFQGLVELRKLLKLKDKDFTKGTHSYKRTQQISSRARKISTEIYSILAKKMKKWQILRDFSFTDDARSKLDFMLQNEAQNCALDVFYSKDDRTLVGCINSKLKKYVGVNYIKGPIVFICSNEKIGQIEIDRMLNRKKNGLKNNQYILAWENFEKFIFEFSKNRKVEDIISDFNRLI